MTPPRLVPTNPALEGESQGAEINSPVVERSLILHAARSGDVRAFATLVDMYYARCLRFALHMLSSRSDAEEAVQDTFVRLYRALPKYREGAPFEPWLFRILANRCYTAGARARRHAQFVEYGDVPDRAQGTGHDATLAWREEIGLALDALPPDQREAFLLHHVEELSYEEMSVITGARVSALKMRVKRACAAMRLRLKEVDRDREK
jgi:RNA polymerase sigma-70 factor (ECF subfamily)